MVKPMFARWAWAFLMLASGCLLLASAATAIIEGYASDSEMRSGDPRVAVALAFFGAIVGIASIVARSRLSRRRAHVARIGNEH